MGGKYRSKVLLCVVFTSLALCVAEIFLRFVSPVDYLAIPLTTDAEASDAIHQASEIPGLAYELKPERRKWLRDAWVETNRYGLRDTASRPPEDTSAFRVAVVGDSYTFGFGVEGHETYANALEDLMAEENPERPVEVLNFGVGGYSTRDAALVIRHRAPPWNPDLIVLGYVLNDPEITPIQPLHAAFDDLAWWRHSHLIRLIAKSWTLREIRRLGGGSYVRYLHASGEPRWQSVLDAFADIRLAVSEKEIPVLVVIFPLTESKSWSKYSYLDLHRQVADAAGEEGLAVLDILDVWSAHPPEAMKVRPDDVHPSVLGHRLVAEAIQAWWESRVLQGLG